MYQVTCHTCEETRRIDALEGAQRTFDEHADEQHDVEVANLETDAEESVTDASYLLASRVDDNPS